LFTIRPSVQPVFVCYDSHAINPHRVVQTEA
jgi:hypothetical protein